MQLNTELEDPGPDWLTQISMPRLKFARPETVKMISSGAHLGKLLEICWNPMRRSFLWGK